MISFLSLWTPALESLSLPLAPLFACTVAAALSRFHLNYRGLSWSQLTCLSQYCSAFGLKQNKKFQRLIFLTSIVSQILRRALWIFGVRWWASSLFTASKLRNVSGSASCILPSHIVLWGAMLASPVLRRWQNRKEGLLDTGFWSQPRVLDWRCCRMCYSTNLSCPHGSSLIVLSMA